MNLKSVQQKHYNEAWEIITAWTDVLGNEHGEDNSHQASMVGSVTHEDPSNHHMTQAEEMEAQREEGGREARLGLK